MLDYFFACPTYKQLKRYKGDWIDNSPDLLYHYSFETFRCCIVRNCSLTTGLFGSYSVKCLGLPPAIGSWRTVFNGSFPDCLTAFKQTVTKHLVGEYDVS